MNTNDKNLNTENTESTETAQSEQDKQSVENEVLKVKTDLRAGGFVDVIC